MQATLKAPTTGAGHPLLANLFGAVIAALIVTSLTGTPLPLLSSDRAIFVALVVLGMTMCALGGVGRAPFKYGWTHPVTLLGITIGCALLLLAAGVLGGFLADRVAIIAFAALFAIKWAIGLAFVQ